MNETIKGYSQKTSPPSLSDGGFKPLDIKTGPEHQVQCEKMSTIAKRRDWNIVASWLHLKLGNKTTMTDSV